MFVTHMTKFMFLNTVIFNLFKNFQENSVKSVKKFLPTQFVACVYVKFGFHWGNVFKSPNCGQNSDFMVGLLGVTFVRFW